MTKIPKFIVSYQTAEMGEIVRRFLDKNGYPWTLSYRTLDYNRKGVGNFCAGGNGHKQICFYGHIGGSAEKEADYIFHAETDFGKMVEVFSKPEYKQITLNGAYFARVFKKTTEIWALGNDKNYYALINNDKILDLQPLIDAGEDFDWKKVSIACAGQEEKAAAAELLSKFCGVPVGVVVSTHVAYGSFYENITGYGSTPSENVSYHFWEIPELLLNAKDGAKRKIPNVNLTTELVAEKDKHGIKVGCQTFNKEKIQELIDLVKES